MLLAYISKNKISPQMPNVYHMCKLLNMHQWGTYASIYATAKEVIMNQTVENKLKLTWNMPTKFKNT